MFSRKIKLAIAAILWMVCTTGCMEAPEADNTAPAEQERHSIRYLARRIPNVEPNVFIIEVDGQRFVAVCNSGCAVAPLPEKESGVK